MTEGLLRALALKALPRAGWVRHGLRDPESVAAHSWGVAVLVLALLPEELDLRRALSYAVLHDLPEAVAGDWTPHDGRPREDKIRAEHEAMGVLAALLPRGGELARTWRAYEAQADPEARFVRQLDRVDMALQAAWYAREQGRDLREFLGSARRVVDHPVLVGILDEIDVAMSDPAGLAAFPTKEEIP
ncbi:MAG: HD domain-containing protein [Alphaproteobacteria bacterium]|nr:HD domain-containing protein [Alphaproteobacteria bacterium]MCB9696569.1 HD domain-containing protein [Alphaproteobacteria bacterium]